MTNKIDDLLLEKFSPEEIRLLESWKGQTPQQLAKAMCDEFKKNFPSWEEGYKWFGGNFLKPGLPLDEVAYPKSNTWSELQSNLRQVARRFSWDTELLGYWDRMRSIMLYLPADHGQRSRRRCYRQADKGKKTWEEVHSVQEMGMCSLCWRAVPKRKGIHSAILCHIHSCMDQNERRRLHRLRYGKDTDGVSRNLKLFEKYHDLLEPLKSDKTITELDNTETRVIEKYRIDDAWNCAPQLIIALLPYVKSHLTDCGTNLSKSHDIIRMLESPAPIDENEELTQFREDFYDDCAEYFRCYVEHLIWAEIWLELEANTQHGGARKGAGRKPK